MLLLHLKRITSRLIVSFVSFLSWLYSVNLAVGFRGLNNLLRDILRGFFVAHEIKREAASALRDLAHIGAEIVHFGHRHFGVYGLIADGFCRRHAQHAAAALRP